MKSGNQEIRKLIRELEQGKKKLRVEYNKGIRALDNAIDALQQLEHNTASISAPVNINAAKRGRPSGGVSLSAEIRDVIASKKKFLHQRDIVAALKKNYPEEDEILFGKKISVLLSNLKRKGVLITVNEGTYRRNMYWGLPGASTTRKRK